MRQRIDANRRFAELAGVNCEPRLIKEWPVHYGDELVYTSVDPQDGTNPEIRYVYPPIIDYAADAREVLRVMMEREDWPEFVEKIGITYYTRETWGGNPDTAFDKEHYAIVLDLILDTTGRLRDMAIEWMEGRK